jgi:hypothetical protein
MASSLAPASWALPLQTGGAGAAAAAAGPSCRAMLAVAEPRWAAALRRPRVLVAPARCAALDGPGASGEEAKIEEQKKKKKKPARGRPVWRRILFASKKTRSIIILNALTVIYGVRMFLISLTLSPSRSSLYYMFNCSVSNSTLHDSAIVNWCSRIAMCRCRLYNTAPNTLHPKILSPTTVISLLQQL